MAPPTTRHINRSGFAPFLIKDWSSDCHFISALLRDPPPRGKSLNDPSLPANLCPTSPSILLCYWVTSTTRLTHFLTVMPKGRRRYEKRTTRQRPA